MAGNAIFIGEYNRNLTIKSNEFEFIGESAMAAWGVTSTKLNAAGNKTLPWPLGPDGRDGNQPIGTQVVGNIVKEVGIWQKQSSPWFQAVTARTLLRGNVLYNGPRAGFNFNDVRKKRDRLHLMASVKRYPHTILSTPVTSGYHI